MTRPLHEMSRAEIISMLSAPGQRVPPRVRQFLAELLEDYEPEEIPDVLSSLARAAEALKEFPTDADLMSLSLRQLGPVLGYGTNLPDEIEIPGVEIPGFLDMPLAELGSKIGPFEFRMRLQEFGKQLDREQAAALNSFADRYRFPD